jgi:hypothetical protein
VPANFLGFRYAISFNGRYIAFNDAAKKLHLLDRATNTQVPLPGIEVYPNPGGLSVSNTGRIAFDNDGGGPALVYESATGQFPRHGPACEQRPPADSPVRRRALLATTCNDSGCVVNLDIGADPYVQDLTMRSDTGFPNDALFDEDRPCIDVDGSLVGFDKPSGLLQPRNVYVFDRSMSPPLDVTPPGLNDSLKDDSKCVLDATGDYIGLSHDKTGTATFRVFQRASGQFITLPADKESTVARCSASTTRRRRHHHREVARPPRPPPGIARSPW